MSQDWLRSYEESEKISDEINQLIHQKVELESEGRSSAKVKAQIRKKSELLSGNIRSLKATLADMEGNLSQYQIGPGEFNRRFGLVSQLEQQVSRSKEALEGKNKNRKVLGLDDAVSQKRIVSESGFMKGKSNQLLYEEHKSRLEDNDKALDSIHAGVVRVKNIAGGMNDELDLHRKLLDDVDTDIDRVNDRLQTNTSLIQKVGRKAKSAGGFWMIILLLIVIIM